MSLPGVKTINKAKFIVFKAMHTRLIPFGTGGYYSSVEGHLVNSKVDIGKEWLEFPHAKERAHPQLNVHAVM